MPFGPRRTELSPELSSWSAAPSRGGWCRSPPSRVWTQIECRADCRPGLLKPRWSTGARTRGGRFFAHRNEIESAAARLPGPTIRLEEASEPRCECGQPLAQGLSSGSLP